MKFIVVFVIILGCAFAGLLAGAAIGFNFIANNHDLWQLLSLFLGLGAGLWIGQRMAVGFLSRMQQ